MSLRVLCSLLLLFLSIASTNAYAQKNNMEINSKSYILMDFTTGTILAEKNKDLVLPPASLTKIMTSYIVFDKLKKGEIKKTDIVPITNNAVKIARQTNSARSFFEERHEIDLDTALKGLIVHSGNDAAITLAEFISGSESNFVKLMNSYAVKLNMKNTKFNNSSGLPINNHFSTANDIALLSRSIIKNFPELYAYYFSIKGFTYNDIYQPNRNKLLFKEEHFDGIKTGWTNNAGYCYATSIIKDGRRLIIVTLNAENPEDRFEDAVKLSHYGLDNFTNIVLTEKDKPINGFNEIPVYLAEKPTTTIIPDKTIILTLKNSEIDKIRSVTKILPLIKAPFPENKKVGIIEYYKNNQLIESVNLVTSEEKEIGGLTTYIADKISLLFNI